MVECLLIILIQVRVLVCRINYGHFLRLIHYWGLRDLAATNDDFARLNDGVVRYLDDLLRTAASGVLGHVTQLRVVSDLFLDHYFVRWRCLLVVFLVKLEFVLSPIQWGVATDTVISEGRVVVERLLQ